MTTETMVVHKALAEIKILKDRIEDEIADSVFVSCKKHSQAKISGIDEEEYKKNIVGHYDKTTDLMNRYTALKRAVMLSNATTKVKIKINGKEEELTVAETIEMKNNGVTFKKLELEKMEQQLAQAKAKVNRENADLENKSENYVVNLFGQKEGKTSTDEVNKAKQQYIDLNTWELVDPISIEKKIEELKDEINSFMSEVDSVLSTSNALTTITIEY